MSAANTKGCWSSCDIGRLPWLCRNTASKDHLLLLCSLGTSVVPSRGVCSVDRIPAIGSVWEGNDGGLLDTML